ncbi:AAA family ATPase [Halobacillus sp. A5]|uniref:AAA family ATPase n=1 Tax=Halobacillus sp. A5 TaxID=2880263 RepID=UPI0020A677E5|nr:AAA family ATPase [Halobacillus sp. A5]
MSKLFLENFRCFGDESPTEIDLHNLTLFIGANSTGKTTTNNALLKLFSPYKKERLIEESDFHNPTNEKVNQKNSLSIEVILSFPELGEEISSDTIPPHFNHMAISEQQGDPYVRLRLEASLTEGNSIEPNIDQCLYYILSPVGTKPEDEIKKIVKPSERSQIQMFYIPASRNPSSQLKNTSGTIFGRILNGINWPKDIEENVKEELKSVDKLFDEVSGVKVLRSVINRQWGKLHKDSRYTSTNVSFNHSNLDSILKKVEVYFEPSERENNFKIDQLGDGLQSLFYLSLVNSLLEIEKIATEDKTKRQEDRHFKIDPPLLTIVALEEPENHVSPHLLGRIVNGFLKLSKQENAQVTVSTHSPSMIKRIEPVLIKHFRMNYENGTSIVRSIELPEEGKESEYKYVKGAVKAYPELYFSNLVILCEGDSEEIIIPRLLELINKDVDFSSISIVPLGGKHVNHFWKLLSELNIPFVTLIDLDRERDGGGWGRIKYALEQLIKIGVNKEQLLKLANDEILQDQALANMHNWDVNTTENMQAWMKRLENYEVFFSSPLDIDFVMLEGFLEEYKKTIPKAGGPRGIEEGKHTPNYKEKLEKSIRATLKQNGGNGETFTEPQRDLMIWYNYFFLGRGKPSTHIEAMEHIEEDNLREKIPESFKCFLNNIHQKLQVN